MSNTEAPDPIRDLTSGTTVSKNSVQTGDSLVDIGFSDLVAEGSVSLLGKHNGVMDDWLYDLYMDESVC